MDPLSVTASILTLLSTAGVVLKELERLRSRLNPGVEFLTLMNSVTDVQATLITVRDCTDTLANSIAPAAQQSYRDLPYAIDKTQASLDRLVDFIWGSLLRKGNGMSRLSLNENKKKRLSELRGAIFETHHNLQLILLSANLRQTPRLLSAIEEAVIVENNHYVKTSETLEQIIAQITALKEEKSEGSASARDRYGSSLALIDAASAQRQPGEVNASVASHQLRITTSLPLKHCEPSCNCQCHVRIQYRTPRWLSAVVGTLFYSSTEVPALDIRPCNSTKCLRSQPTSSSRFTYYFPTWMMRSAIVYSAWGNLDGINSSWVVRMPREIPLYRPCWHHIRHGHHDEIRQLLQERDLSPYDIGPDGVSVLHWAEHYWRFDICSLLATAGADWQFKDRIGRSPADAAWIKILRNEPTDPYVIQLRGLVGSDDSYDLNLSPIHRIIVGLSSANIQKQLDLEPSRVDEQDWTGKSALMWAAFRADHINLQILLSHHASVDLKDRENRTALHYAARVGSLECVSQLLDAGADPNVFDINGGTPLHDAMYAILPQSLIEELVSALKNHYADVEARDHNGWTPLFRAVEQQNSSGIRALAKFAGDINAFDYNEVPPISRAIFHCDYESIETLCELGARLCWTTTLHALSNVLEEAALFGTVETMNILAASRSALIDYDPNRLERWFTELRDRYPIYGQRFPLDEELATFQNLLDKKGNKIASAIKEDTLMNIEHDEQDVNDEEQSECFEDALENFSHLATIEMEA